jgi:hypothetical protein
MASITETEVKGMPQSNVAFANGWMVTLLAAPLPSCGRMTNVIILKGPITCSVIPNKYTQHYGKTVTTTTGFQPGKNRITRMPPTKLSETK